MPSNQRDARPLVAPDKFKGTFSAREVAHAIAAGLGGDCDVCPIADGGEGTAEILLEALGGEWRSARVHDAIGRPVEARFALLEERTGPADNEWRDPAEPDAQRRIRPEVSTAVVEVAEASGMWRLAPDELDPLGATSTGTGELIAAAVAAGARRVLLACGGSATTDGGAGALSAFDPGAAEIVCLCDTDATFTAAAPLYAPQKGAGPGEVEALRERLEAMRAELPHDPGRLPYTGAAGGLSGGLWAHGARLVPGARHVLGAIGFDRRLERASSVLTGEGRLDATSFRGKAVGEVARRSVAAGIPCHAIVGSVGDLPDAARQLASITEAATLEEIERAVAARPPVAS